MREAQLEKLYDNSIISPELYILDDQTGFTKDLNQILELDSFK